MTRLDRPVWYVAFGSNLYRPRLLAYLQGTKTPGSPAGLREAGARDTSPPAADSYHALPYQLYFANQSKKWGGGVAFVDQASQVVTPTIGRRYLITWGQLEDLFRQENGASETLAMSEDELRTNGHVSGYGGWYSTLLHCGDTSGVPLATITSTTRHPTNPPSPAYLEVISKGLGQLGYDDAPINEYLGKHRSAAF